MDIDDIRGQSRVKRRAALIALLSLPMGYYQALSAQGATLSVDLGQWKALRVVHKGQTIELSMTDIWEALNT